MPRLGYSKSRTGCTRCRQRRVKCDEKRPSCSACERHKISCSLAETASIPREIRPIPSRRIPSSEESFSSSSSTTGADGDLRLPPLMPLLAGSTARLPALSQTIHLPQAAPSLGSFPYCSKFASGPREKQQKICWVTDLELMHHYSTETCLTLPRGDEVSHIWQIEMVKVAFTYEPALHCILAVSAFHLAYLRPEHRHTYTMVGSQHRSDADRGLRADLTHLKPEVAEACFAAASLLVICSFAALAVDLREEDHSHPTLKAMFDIFALIRIMNAALQKSELALMTGRFADFFRSPKYTSRMVHLEAICSNLHELSLRLTEERADWVTAQIVDREIHTLIKCIRESITSAPVPELRIVTTWPIFFTEAFLTLLNQRSQMALTVFAYYCAVVHESGSKVWYTRGWGTYVGKDLVKHITSPWRQTIQCALDRMHIQMESYPSV